MLPNAGHQLTARIAILTTPVQKFGKLIASASAIRPGARTTWETPTQPLGPIGAGAEDNNACGDSMNKEARWPTPAGGTRTTSPTVEIPNAQVKMVEAKEKMLVAHWKCPQRGRFGRPRDATRKRADSFLFSLLASLPDARYDL